MNDRANRLKTALRENLKRRKAHARERKALDGVEEPVASSEAKKEKSEQV